MLYLDQTGKKVHAFGDKVRVLEITADRHRISAGVFRLLPR